jgi:3-oxoacyl-[acyl-carrier protein] reductase
MSRSVLVSGGNRGIGLAVAVALAAQGDRVAVTYRSGQPPEGLLAVRCDVTDAEQVDRAYTAVEAEHGPVEVLVANAGVTRDRLVLQMTDEDFSSVIDTNLGGAFRMVKRALGGMVEARSGRIVLISSAVAMLGAAGQANYAASKSGLVGLARSLARQLGGRNVTVNVVAPGFVETDMTAALTERQRQKVLSQIPLGRAAVPADIVAVVRFLTSPEAAYVTGAVIQVDGGWGMGQ